MNRLGTVEKIVEVLNKMCHDKKSQATARYEQHSAWLAEELTTIRNLIEKPDATYAASSSSCAASRQKRKSPETCNVGKSDSPEHKRLSGTDIADLLVEENLPADLNKLKKDQLLHHLNERGYPHMTMKSLKKELIEKLKEVVIDLHRRKIPEIPPELSNASNDDSVPQESHEPSQSNETIDESKQHEQFSNSKKENNVDMSSSTIQSNEGKLDEAALHEHDGLGTAVEQNGSSDIIENSADEGVVDPKEVSLSETKDEPLIEKNDDATEERVERVSDSGISNEESSSPRKQSVLSEYRQKMASAVRSSLVSRPQVEEGESEEERKARLQSEFEARKMRHRQSHIRKSDGSKGESLQDNNTTEELPLQSLMNTNSSEQSGKTTLEIDTDEDSVHSNWNEVPSPKREADEAASFSTKQDCHESQSETKHSIPTKEATAHLDSTKPEQVDQSKKPSNLVGGNQLSFLSSKPSTTTATATSKTKTVVPALAMAARQKEKEEARALQKKKELEEKRERMRKMQQQKQTSAAPGPSRLFSSKQQTTTASSKASEKGFGWFLGGKKKEVEQEASQQQSNTKENKAIPTPKIPVALKSDKAISQPPSSPAVLSEKKINPADYAPPTPPAQTATPGSTTPSPPRDEYKIDLNDDDDDDSDSSSGTDDDDDDKKKRIPEWAKGPSLREALERQYGLNGHTAVDPDLIFSEVQTCSLEEIFGKQEGKCGKYSVRTSSAKWDEDEITLVEKRKYRSQMGYI